jgi:hypothetical protein
VAKNDLYDVTMVYKENFKRDGRAFVRAGTIQRSIKNRDTTTNVITLKDVPFLKGEHRVETWYQSWGMPFTPIYVEITCKNTN